MLNGARVASFGFFKDNICITRIHKEKKFKIKFQVPLKFAQILPDYTYFENKESPIICYKYNKPIRSIVFNYNKLVTELDIENSITDS